MKPSRIVRLRGGTVAVDVVAVAAAVNVVVVVVIDDAAIAAAVVARNGGVGDVCARRGDVDTDIRRHRKKTMKI